MIHIDLEKYIKKQEEKNIKDEKFLETLKTLKKFLYILNNREKKENNDN